MVEIRHRFPIRAPMDRVYLAVTTPAGLNAWWTLTASGSAVVGTEYEFGFGPGFGWRAVVVQCDGRTVEWEFTVASDDWVGTRVGFTLEGAEVDFWHTGWAEATPHFRGTSYCWAMYLRLLKRWVEHGEAIPYEQRLEA